MNNTKLDSSKGLQTLVYTDVMNTKQCASEWVLDIHVVEHIHLSLSRVQNVRINSKIQTDFRIHLHQLCWLQRIYVEEGDETTKLRVTLKFWICEKRNDIQTITWSVEKCVFIGQEFFSM